MVHVAIRVARSNRSWGLGRLDAHGRQTLAPLARVGGLAQTEIRSGWASRHGGQRQAEEGTGHLDSRVEATASPALTLNCFPFHHVLAFLRDRSQGGEAIRSGVAASELPDRRLSFSLNLGRVASRI